MARDPGEFPALAVAYRLSAVLLTAMALGVPEAIAGGARRADDVARAVGADPVVLGRLVRVLVAADVLERDEEGALSLTPFGERMRTDAGDHLATMVLGWQGLWEAYRGYGELPDAVRTGAPPFARVFGTEFHDYLAAHPDRMARYSAAVESTTDAFDVYARSYPFDRFTRVVDIGGGRGGLLRSVCAQHAGVDGVLVDLPAVVAGVDEELAAAGLADRISVVPLDALASVPPPGDVYVFSTVLRCFGDDDAARFLQNVRTASATATVLIADFVMDERPELPYALADIHNLITYGGRDRTLAEWTALLDGVGYAVADVHDFAGEAIPMIEAAP